MATAKFNLSLEHILVAVAELGKLHGSMYGLKQTDRSGFDAICEQLHESRFVFDSTAEEWDRRLRIGPQRATAAVRKAQQNGDGDVVPEWFLKRLEEVLSDTFGYQKKTALRQSEPLAIMCHGDFLRNNIAFQYIDETDDVPQRAMLFDFQTLRYASPALDLATFMVNSTGFAVRQQHFDRIFGTYHTALLQHFRRVTMLPPDAPAPDHLSVDNMLREYALYLPYGLSIGGSFLPVLHVPDDIAFEDYAGRSVESEIEDAWKRGGEALDAELQAIVEEMYRLYERFDLELKEEF